MLLPVLRVLLETEASHRSEQTSSQILDAAAKVLSEWITDSNPKLGGKSIFAMLVKTSMKWNYMPLKHSAFVNVSKSGKCPGYILGAFVYSFRFLEYLAMTGGTSLCTGTISSEAADNLVQHAVPVLELCLRWRPADDGQMLRLLRQLASAEAWSRTEPELAAPGSSSPAQKARHTNQV